MNINFKTLKNEYGVLLIGNFDEVSGDTLLGIDIKLVSYGGECKYLEKDKPIYIVDGKGKYVKLIYECEFDSNLIIEVHNNGSQLYIGKFLIESQTTRKGFLYINFNVKYRLEDSQMYSIFNTNGNIIFLRGIYYHIWNMLLNTHSEDTIINNLYKLDFTKEKVIKSLAELVSRGLIVRTGCDKIDMI